MLIIYTFGIIFMFLSYKSIEYPYAVIGYLIGSIICIIMGALTTPMQKSIKGEEQNEN